MNVRKDVKGRELFLQNKVKIALCISLMKIIPVKIRKVLLVNSRNIKGIIGIGIRYILLKSLAHDCGDNVVIKENVYLFNPERLCFGNNVISRI